MNRKLEKMFDAIVEKWDERLPFFCTSTSAAAAMALSLDNDGVCLSIF